jgi:hypothetical protein
MFYTLLRFHYRIIHEADYKTPFEDIILTDIRLLLAIGISAILMVSIVTAHTLHFL